MYVIVMHNDSLFSCSIGWIYLCIDLQGSNVLVVCTTEMPELLSPKLRKLLGHTFYVPLPSEKDRKDVLEFYDQFFGRKCCSGTLWSQEELDRVACQANYFSISELKRKIWSKFVCIFFVEFSPLHFSTTYLNWIILWCFISYFDTCAQATIINRLMLIFFSCVS